MTEHKRLRSSPVVLLSFEEKKPPEPLAVEEDEPRIAETEKENKENKEWLGEGSYGHVFGDGTVAIKYADQDETEYKLTGICYLFLREAASLMRLKHCPYIVDTLDIGQEENTINIHMIQYKRSLRDHLCKRRRRHIRRWMFQILSALAESHRLGVLHRDLKPDNVLVDDERNVVLADWGLSRWCTTTAAQQDTKQQEKDEWYSPTMCPPFYRPPELFFEPLEDSLPYSFKGDCWSAGMLMLWMRMFRDKQKDGLCWWDPPVDFKITLTHLFGQDPVTKGDRDLGGPCPCSILQKWKDRFAQKFGYHDPEDVGLYPQQVLEGLLKTSPRERWSAAQALAHPWFSGLQTLPNRIAPARGSLNPSFSFHADVTRRTILASLFKVCDKTSSDCENCRYLHEHELFLAVDYLDRSQLGYTLTRATVAVHVANKIVSRNPACWLNLPSQWIPIYRVNEATLVKALAFDLYRETLLGEVSRLCKLYRIDMPGFTLLREILAHEAYRRFLCRFTVQQIAGFLLCSLHGLRIVETSWQVELMEWLSYFKRQ